MQQLVTVCTDANTSLALKESCFLTLGYVCEELAMEPILLGQSNVILNAISTGMKPEQKNNNIKLAAARALSCAIKLAARQFAIKEYRDLIMRMVFNSVSCEDIKIKAVSFESLATIAEEYYQYIGGYMGPIFDLTSKAIKSGVENVANPAIEFWSSINDVEIDIQNEEDDRKNFEFMKKAAPKVSLLLLECLTKQNDDPNDDSWDTRQAAGVCLQLTAKNIGNAVVPLVFPFIRQTYQNVKTMHWRRKEAATLAFASILEGPEKKFLVALVTQAFPVIINFMRDESPHVKDTAAWTIGKICEALPETISAKVLPPLMGVLRHGLKESPKIAGHICWAIQNLSDEVKVVNGTSALSKYFPFIVKDLLDTTNRNDANEDNLLLNAFEAMNTFIDNSAPDTDNFILQLIPELLKRLKATFSQGSVSQIDADRQAETRAQLCATFQFILRKTPQGCSQYMNTIMEAFVLVLKTPRPEVHEDGLLGISAAANASGANFINYMGVVHPLIMRLLKDHRAHTVCGIAAGCYGDISRAIESKIAPFCNDIIKELLAKLQTGSLDRSIKPRIIDCLGDIALAIKGTFRNYLKHVMPFLESAAQVNFKKEHRTDDNLDYLNILRESVLEAYASIMQGLLDDNAVNLMLPFSEKMVMFLAYISNDPDLDPRVIKSANSLICDVTTLLAPLSAPLKAYMRNTAAIKKLVTRGLKDETDTANEMAELAKDALTKLG